LQGNDCCLVECVTKRIWTRATSTNGICCVPAESSHGGIMCYG